MKKVFVFNSLKIEQQEIIANKLKNSGITPMYKKIGRNLYQLFCETDKIEVANLILNNQ